MWIMRIVLQMLTSLLKYVIVTEIVACNCQNTSGELDVASQQQWPICLKSSPHDMNEIYTTTISHKTSFEFEFIMPTYIVNFISNEMAPAMSLLCTRQYDNNTMALLFCLYKLIEAEWRIYASVI